MERDPNCIFCKIVAKEVKSEIVYEDDKVVAFKDIDPQAPIHILVVPKKHIPTLNDLNEEDYELISHVFKVIKKLSQDFEVENRGYRVVVNYLREAGQSIYHIHFHFLAGRPMRWPPG